MTVLPYKTQGNATQRDVTQHHTTYNEIYDIDDESQLALASLFKYIKQKSIPEH